MFFVEAAIAYNGGMSWASRRKTAYAIGVFIFFAIVVGGPLGYWYFSIPPSCYDSIQNQGETKVDRGGPCPLLDDEALTPPGLLWTRAFRVREGTYSAVAYMQNPNAEAGVREVKYRFRMYDERNVLVTERQGETYVMPGSVTAVFEGGIETGSRVVAHTYFDFIQTPQWERLVDTSSVLVIKDTTLTDTETIPRLTATIQNTSVKERRNIKLVAIVSDPAGNAFTASQTALPLLLPGQREEVIFTWPTPLSVTVGRVMIIPLSAPGLPQ